MTDPTPLDEGSRRRTGITDGMANAMVRYGAARQCPGCQFGVPKYPGRYPRFCPRCGDELQMPKEEKARKKVKESAEVPVVCTSRAVRIQKIIESGRASFENYLNDAACSRVVSVPYSSLKEHGGAEGVQAFFEGPVNGLYYRIEEREDPLIVAEFDNKHAKLRLFATRDPARYLALDPREDIVAEDYEATFEKPLTEGILQDVADKALGFLSARLAKLWKAFGTLRAVKAIWDEAQRASGIKLPVTATLRIAQGLDSEMETALRGVQEGKREKLATPRPLTEAVTLLTVLSFVIAIIGGMPMLLNAISKAARWLGFPAIQRAFARMSHVAHAIEQEVIDFAIPAELSYQVYLAMWKRGWRVSTALGRHGSKHLEGDKPLPFENYLTDGDFQRVIETGMWRLLLAFFFVNGAMHILATPLGLLFAGEAAATGVKGVELGQGLQRAMAFAKAQGPRMARMAMEAVNPTNVRMVEVRGEHLEAHQAAALQLFVTESDARGAAERLGLALAPVRKLVGEAKLYALVHEGTGLALGRGEAARLDEYFAQDRARQRIADQGHTRVAGEFHEDKRASAKRPRKPGEGPTQIRGGFRIHVGANQTRKPNKDAEKSLQNKMNAKRGLRARISGAKKWHRSREGKQLHAALGNYNRESMDVSAALRAKILDVQDRIIRHNAGQQRQPARRLGENTEQMAQQITTRSPGPTALDNPQPDDHLEAILRRLIVTQNMDVLQDVEFDDSTGSLYLFFDPVLTGDEVQEVLSAVKQERGEIQLIASPDMSIPGESVESEWWVLFLPGPNETAIPDPSVYARNPEDHYTKVQAVVMAPQNAPEAVAQGIDVSAMLNAAGGS
jgi:hypothetical protein